MYIYIYTCIYHIHIYVYIPNHVYIYIYIYIYIYTHVYIYIYIYIILASRAPRSESAVSANCTSRRRRVARCDCTSAQITGHLGPQIATRVTHPSQSLWPPSFRFTIDISTNIAR